jgi:hypothetical protein
VTFFNYISIFRVESPCLITTVEAFSSSFGSMGGEVNGILNLSIKSFILSFGCIGTVNLSSGIFTEFLSLFDKNEGH